MWTKLSKQLSRFRKNHNTQHALLKMIKTWCFALNKGNKVGGMVMDLLKATLNYNLLFYKLKTYDFNTNTLTFIQSYFSNRHQGT